MLLQEELFLGYYLIKRSISYKILHIAYLQVLADEKLNPKKDDYDEYYDNLDKKTTSVVFEQE